MLNKVPEVTLYFWVIKILCTTVGETAADYLNTQLGFGLTNTTYVVGALLAAILVLQFRVRKYIPGVYWVAVVLISVVGTLITDNLTDNFGVALQVSTVLFAVGLAAAFAAWYASEKTLSIHTIYSTKREAFYWLVILFTFALGTAAGDLVAEQFNIGYLNSVFLFVGIIAVIGIARFGLEMNAVATFWAAYIITRPLGASIGDFLSQDTVDGGLGLGSTVTSLVFLVAILAAVVYLMVTKKDEIVLENSDGAERVPPAEASASTSRTRLIGWGGAAATIALTIGVMATASATGLAKSPSAATLLESEDAGGATAAADSVAAPAAGASSATVDVTLSEWSIVPSVTSAKAGAITFNIKNAGPAKRHEFIILKTDIAPDALPTVKDKSLNEDGAGITSPGEGGILAVGKAETVTVAMAPGTYIFVDNIVENGLVHWEKKAYATFTVQPSAASAKPASASAAGSSIPSGNDASKLSVTGGLIGGTASATMRTAPGAACTITYVHPSGKTSALKALAPQNAGPDGVASWTWSIDPGTSPSGQGTVTVACGSDKATQPITISPAVPTP